MGRLICNSVRAEVRSRKLTSPLRSHFEHVAAACWAISALTAKVGRTIKIASAVHNQAFFWLSSVRVIETPYNFLFIRFTFASRGD
jgi:hypothetical protein